MGDREREETEEQHVTDITDWLEDKSYNPPSKPSWGPNTDPTKIADNVVKNVNWFMSTGGFKEYADANIPDSQNPGVSPAMMIGSKTVKCAYRSGSLVVFLFTDWSSSGKSVADALTVVEGHSDDVSGGSSESYLDENVEYPPSDPPPKRGGGPV